MASKKKIEVVYFRKSRTRILILIGVIVLVISVMIAILGLRVNFLINDELQIKLKPLDKNIISAYDQANNVTFEFMNDNSFLCKSECTYKLIDIGSNKVVDEQTLVLKSKSKVIEGYDITPSFYGSGQDIYSFQVSCHNINSFLCATDRKNRFKSSFITLSYDLSEEEREKVLDINSELNNYLIRVRYSDELSRKIGYALDTNKEDVKDSFAYGEFKLIENKYKNLNVSVSYYLNESVFLIYLWDTNKYSDLREIINKSDNLGKIILNLNETFIDYFNMIDDYNVILYDLNSLLNQSKEIDSIINYYNDTNDTVNLAITLEFKEKLMQVTNDFTTESTDNANYLKNQINNLRIEYIVINNLTINNLSVNDLFEEFDFDHKYANVIINKSFKSDLPEIIKLKEPICCVFGSCKTCCITNICREDPRLYPILLVHGHALNKNTSPETSLNSFSKIQQKLQEEGIINAGQLDLQNVENIPAGEYGKSGNPISIQASYYYLHYYDIGSYRISTQKSERIENYALRLKDIIDIVKARTGAKKVNIVAHSMGGLVSREYIRLFGGDSVDKLVLIGTANHGVTGRTRDLCNFLGSKKECDDMEKDSVFLKRLNNAPVPESIRTYTIGAKGCPTEGVEGDGIVDYESVTLDYAINYDVMGECTDLFKSNLHEFILDPEKMPDVYSILKEILKDT